VAEVAEKKEHPRGVARTIWVLEHTQDLVSIVVGVLLAGLAVVMLVLGVVDFFRDVASGSPVETAGRRPGPPGHRAGCRPRR
jgi:hypothetical protein